MTRLCKNLKCQKPLVRKRYDNGKPETQAVFERRLFCSLSCAVTSRHAENRGAKTPTNLTTTNQVNRQAALNAWR